MTAMAATIVSDEQVPALTAKDRCDRCGAQAYTAFVKEDSELLFCRHHGNGFEVTLLAAGWSMLADQRAELEQPKAPIYS